MRTSLLRKLLWLVLPLALVPFLATALYAYSAIFRSMLEQSASRRRLLMAQTVSAMGREIDAARKELEYLADLSLTKRYLAAEGYSASGSGPAPLLAESMRGVAEGLFQENTSYLEMMLVDRTGLVRMHLSRLEGTPCPISFRESDVFINTLIMGELQSPVELCPATVYSFLLARSVADKEFAGLVLVRCSASRLERALRPLLANNQLSAFLVDDRGIVFAKALASSEEEMLLHRGDLKRVVLDGLTNASGELLDVSVSGERQQFLLSAMPAEEYINFTEPIPGENWFLGVLEPEPARMAQVRAFRAVFLTILILTVAAATGAAIYYSRKLAAPLRDLAVTTMEIARGNFEVNPAVKTRDEMEDLAEAIKKMAADLKRSQAELVASERLAAMGEMTAEISHEIQNRIGGIGLWLQHLDAEMPHADPHRKLVDELKGGIKEFELMLSRLKDYYRSPELIIGKADMPKLVASALESVRAAAERKGIRWSCEIDPLPTVECDADQIKSVLLNLLYNAVEASPSGGVVVVHARNQDDAGRTVLRIDVTDQGRGMTAEEQEKIFLPFYSTKSYGSGLGLAMASKMVKAHGGKIQVESVPNHGSTFTVILPVNE